MKNNEQTTSEIQEDAKLQVAAALSWLRKFAIGAAVVLFLVFTALAVVTIAILISIHTGQVHGQHHTQEILNTVTAHDKVLQNTLTNTCALLKKAGTALPSWCTK